MGALYHLDVGCADASVIQTATATFLVDCEGIGDYAHLLPKHKRLKAVFVTHQHSDHYSGLDYLRKHSYAIEYLIYSPYERRRGDNSVTLDEWNEFDDHKKYFEAHGTKLYYPLRQKQWKKPWWDTNGVRFWIIGPHPHIAKGETRELHDASLVITARLGQRKCLFAGDASDTSLLEISRTTVRMCDDILHASHHGSMNGAQLDFIKKCKAKYTVISTAEGVHESVPHPTALKRYESHTEKQVRRTDKDGTWKWTF